jgi:hypothetical protein
MSIQSEKDNKIKKKSRIVFLSCVAVLFLMLVLVFVIFAGAAAQKAVLIINEGAVEVNQGQGWVAAENEMSLSVNDRVRTLDGRAVVILHESSLVQLDENTEVSITELTENAAKVYQSKGSTWNKFIALMGIQSLEVETPTTVVTVRGTEFWVGMDSVGVVDGEVKVNLNKKLFSLVAGRHIKVKAESPVIERNDKAFLEMSLKNKRKILNELVKLRAKEFEKHKDVYGLVKKIKGWSDEDVKRYLVRLDAGEFDEKELRQKVLLPVGSINRFVDLTTAIKKQKKQIAELEQEIESDIESAN